MEKLELVRKWTSLGDGSTRACVGLLEEGNTVPFIARYRKEATGSLDEDQIRVVEKEYAYQAGLAKRKEEVIRLINERGMLTPEIEKEINDSISFSS